MRKCRSGLNLVDMSQDPAIETEILDDDNSSQEVSSELELTQPEDEMRTSFMPYPTSRLCPSIAPPDLSNFKSRGITQVQREMNQQMEDLRQQYVALVDEFNWNKLIYESRFNFEPVVGETYHLYEEEKKEGSDQPAALSLSLIEPQKWQKRFLGTFTLGANGKWRVVEIAEGFDLSLYLSERAD